MKTNVIERYKFYPLEIPDFLFGWFFKKFGTPFLRSVFRGVGKRKF